MTEIAANQVRAPERILTAGPLSAELVAGNLRTIRWHGHEAIRAIAYLVRDENWGNYPLRISGLDVDEQGDSFVVSYQAEAVSTAGARLAISVRIAGSSGGKLVFEADAVADADFGTNRCGFTILHPIVGVAGQPATVEHTDGTVRESRFPDLIEPSQPFLDMRAITHAIAPGASVECRMEGDTFEMEDQRNWTDASYKTYVRPLALPWPYVVPAGAANRQAITLTFSGRPAAVICAAERSAPVRLSLGPEAGRVPAFGLGIRPEDLPSTFASLDALREIAPQHLVLNFNPLAGHDSTALEAYAKLLSVYRAAATLELVLPCRQAPDAEMREAAAAVERAGLVLSAIAVSPAPDLKSTPPGSAWPECPPLDEVYTAARKAFPGLPLGGGMFSYFTELNRKRPPVHLLDFITHTTSPLVHAADDRSVMETLEALPFVTRSVRDFAERLPYRIGPSSIGMRSNPYGAALNPNPNGERMTMTAHDPRQTTAFAAAWMVGYAAAVASAGLDVLTLGSLAGPFDVVGEGIRYPAFRAACRLSRFAGTRARLVESSDPVRVLALCGGNTVLVANISPERLEVVLDGASADEALPVVIEAYGIYEFDVEARG
ncbi:hypothetical protein CN166_09010 [Sinorhizobium medicae]|uniref:D-apionate lactonase n=1 Tax=Sinorhizobium medicae TaxID=110321 RepID=UPI000FD2C0A7|nr:hypothetical protein [Sinorhizobium medicae]RVJ61092.1 hypothetical protein CN166_09010 [Sinorhizobium medicae]